MGTNPQTAIDYYSILIRVKEANIRLCNEYAFVLCVCVCVCLYACVCQAELEKAQEQSARLANSNEKQEGEC